MPSNPDRTSQTALVDEAAVRAALEAVQIDLHGARSALDHGRTIDLTGIDARIAGLCGQALNLPAERARRTLPDLIALRDAADRLIETLARGRLR